MVKFSSAPTPRQIEVWKKIREFIKENGRGPTISELARYIETTTQSAHYICHRLKEWGYIHFEDNAGKAYIELTIKRHEIPHEHLSASD